MMNAMGVRGDETSTRALLSGAQAEFVAELGRMCNEYGALLRQAAHQSDEAEAALLRDRACTGLRRQSQRAQGFRLHGIAEELKVIAEKAAVGSDLEALAKSAEDAPRLAWNAAEESLTLTAPDRGFTPAPSSGLRDRSAPIPLPTRGDFRVRVVGSLDVRQWADERTDVTVVDATTRGDLLVVDARAVSADDASGALRDALEPLVVVLGGRDLARTHGAIAVDALAELNGVVELAKSRREVALATSPAPARSGRDLGLELVEELHRALVDGIDPSSAPIAVPLGRDPMIAAALWSAIARIRELVTRRTEGRVRYADTGPDGALALAAELSDEVRTGERRRSGERAHDVSLEGLRALVVDDDEVVTWFIAEQLRAAGMSVTEAYDGATARGLAERERPDVIISDVVMPGLDGLSLGRALRRDVTLGDVPLVLLSWKEDLLRRVRELGGEADGYVRKESDSEHLLATVREALRPRIRLMQRLQKDDTVHGRLDGMTAFTLARLVAEAKPHARLVVRDGRHVFELEFVGGLLAGCTRSGTDGSLLRGRRALASYLGVRSARFEAAPLSRQLPSDTAKAIDTAVEPLVERARASVELVVEGWLSLASVEIDLDLVDSGAPALPGSLKRGLDGLRDGIAPHRLVASGLIEADSLLALMLDLARRGAIVSARDNLGTDKLTQTLERVRERSLVTAPKARFSRPIAVPVPLESLHADASGDENEIPIDLVQQSARIVLDEEPVTTAEPIAPAAFDEAGGADDLAIATPRADQIPLTAGEIAPATADDAAAEGQLARDEDPRDAATLEFAGAAHTVIAQSDVVEPVRHSRPAAPIDVKPRTISWIGFLLALGLIALGGTVASWVAVRHLPSGRVPTAFR
jgi:CheY-like chemotaxis protein